MIWILLDKQKKDIKTLEILCKCWAQFTSFSNLFIVEYGFSHVYYLQS